MRAVTETVAINRPVDEVYGYLLDVASRPEFGPELFLDFRLARIESSGVGASARFRFGKRQRDRFAGTTIVKATPLELIREEGSTGRAGRVPLVIEYLLEAAEDGPTKVTLTFATEPLHPIDKLREFGMRRTLAKRAHKAVNRLRGILEGAQQESLGDRPTVGGFDRHRIHNP